MNPWLGIVAGLAALGGAFAVLRVLEKIHAPHPEVLRKLMHVLMGLVTASFPWLFDQTWPVLVLAGGSIVALILVRSGIAATRSVQGVLHGVERASWGELLFPISVAVVFVLADGDALLYCVPILILTLADAVAALIGIRYGLTQFKTLEGSKSIEGSLAFLVVTFLCVHVAVLLFGETSRTESLLIGMLMGILVMMFEAVAWRGLDNLFIPVASFALLQTYIDMDALALSVRLIVILLLGTLLLVWRRHSTLDDSALIGAGLVAYGAWAIGGLFWLLVPVSVFIIATVLSRRLAPRNRQQIHTVYALLGITGPGLVWLILNHNVDSNDLLFGYAVAFAAHLTMLGISRAHFGQTRLPPVRVIPAMFQGMLVLVLPFLSMWGLDHRLLPVTSVGVVAVVVAGLLFLRLQPALDNCPASPARWTRQAMIAGGISVLAWVSIGIVGKGGLQA